MTNRELLGWAVTAFGVVFGTLIAHAWIRQRRLGYK